MAPWMIYSLITVFLWGLWGFLVKSAARSIASENLILLGLIGGLIIFPVYIVLFVKSFKFHWNDANYYLVVLGGMVGILGTLFFYLALSKGEASRVSAITATYPVVTMILVFAFVQEKITIHKSLGIALAILGVYFLSR